MPRPFTLAQRAQNDRFLAALAHYGNARLAARELGVNRSTYFKRRARCPDFAARWDAALAVADEAYARPGAPLPAAPGALRTVGGEAMIVRTRSGRLQLRRAPPGWMTMAAERRFLSVLSGSANVRRAAAAAGFSRGAFYRRVRTRPGFDSAMDLALCAGWHHLLAAVHQSLDLERGPYYGETDEEFAARTEGCPLPPMTVDEALTLLRLHQDWEAARRSRDGDW